MPYACATCDRPLPSIDAACPVCLRSESERRRIEDTTEERFRRGYNAAARESLAEIEERIRKTICPTFDGRETRSEGRIGEGDLNVLIELARRGTQ